MGISNIERAEQILREPSPTITAFRAPASEGTANDYYSDASYWWPDPEKENGLPYIRRDGFFNPANFCRHKDLLLKVVHSAETLCRAYGETEDPRYLEKTEDILNTFFIDERTRMNPSLLYSQAIPGICSGRSIGLIDTASLIDLPFLIRRLHSEGLMDDGFFQRISGWFSEYTRFLLESGFGRTEQNERNNHAIAIFLQIAAFAVLHPERDGIWEICREKLLDDFIPSQIAEDGSMPEELKRTKPYSYSIFSLGLLVTLAEIISERYPSVWHFRDRRGIGIRDAIDFLLPYIADKGSWPYGPDVEGFDALPGKPSFLFFAAEAYRCDEYLEVYAMLRKDMDPTPAVDRNDPVKDPWLYTGR